MVAKHGQFICSASVHMMLSNYSDACQCRIMTKKCAYLAVDTIELYEMKHSNLLHATVLPGCGLIPND